MRRTRFRKQATSMSLFPFLAVLICMMGALIALLVLVVQQASVQAESISEDHRQQEIARAEARQTRQNQREDSLFDLDVMREQRKKLTGQLTDSRLKLSHLEDHMRRLREQWKRLQEQKKQLENVDQSRQQDQQAVEQELKRLQQKIEVAKKDLQAAKEKAAQRKRSFSIVTYKGPNGTLRRPIFVECTQGRIILQPEGIEITDEDLQGLPIPGNPFDAALLATREYLANHGGIGQHGEPYPLLVVRPDGAYSYNFARTAMRSWDTEFGYELIGAGTNLKYPAPDAELAKVLRQAIKDARHRQALLTAEAASRQARRGGSSLGSPTSPNGFVPDTAPENRDGLGPHHQGSGPAKGRGRQTADRSQNNAARQPQPASQESDPQNSKGAPGAGLALSAKPLSQARGKGWANPNAVAGSVGFTRPIRIDCSADQLVIVPPQGSRLKPQVITLKGPLGNDIDRFVTIIWKQVKNWGIAGDRAYWKPVLNVQVADGGRQRYEELRTLLDGSGLTVEWRSN